MKSSYSQGRKLIFLPRETFFFFFLNLTIVYIVYLFITWTFWTCKKWIHIKPVYSLFICQKEQSWKGEIFINEIFSRCLRDEMKKYTLKKCWRLNDGNILSVTKESLYEWLVKGKKYFFWWRKKFHNNNRVYFHFIYIFFFDFFWLFFAAAQESKHI